MNRHVNAIAGRLSLRPPQRKSLEILDRITEISPPTKGADRQTALDVIHSEFPTVTDFERDFPSDIAAVVEKTTQIAVQQTIDIPRILVVPTGEVRCGFRPFTLKLQSLNFPPPSEELWIQHLRTQQVELLSLGRGGIEEARLEDYVVGALVDYDDISYDDHADLLYDLAGQTVSHFRGYLSEEDARRVLRCHQKSIAQFIHPQMQEHFWEEATGYEVKVSRGFTAVKCGACTSTADNPIRDFRQPPPDKKNIAKYAFGKFKRCLCTAVKFQSDAERKLAVILDRDSQKWFKPAKGQFLLFYLWQGEHLEYQPDFVAETESAVYMLEPKAVSDMQDAEVLAKRDVAVKWCKHASDYAATYGGKPWQYALIPHDAISENMTLAGLVKHYGTFPG